MEIRALWFASVAVCMHAMPVYVHHSFAMFDAERTTALAGTVKEFQWTNPHAWIILQVAGRNGQQAEWAIQLNGPADLVRQGWRPKILTSGMSVTITIHPLRDGTNGGQFLTLTLPDGTRMGAGPGQGSTGGQTKR
jgi:Family of unknown function (DUF6152)